MMMRRLDRALDADGEKALDAHLRECAECARENELLCAADGLLRSVDIPPVAEAEWPAVCEAVPAGLEDALAAASEPPQITEEEWSQTWDALERELLLGDGGERNSIDIRRARRRRARWYEVALGAAAALAIAVGAYFMVWKMFPEERGPMPYAKDVIKVGPGYAYATLGEDGDSDIYVVTVASDIDESLVRSGRGYAYAEPAGDDLIEIAPINAIELEDDEYPIIIPWPAES
jgi:hypothetical protein